MYTQKARIRIRYFLQVGQGGYFSQVGQGSALSGGYHNENALSLRSGRSGTRLVRDLAKDRRPFRVSLCDIPLTELL